MPFLKVSRDHSGLRLDVFVSRNADLSREKVIDLIRSGRVTVNNRVVKKPSLKVKDGDVVFFEVPPPEKIELEPQDIHIDVVYEDEHVIVVNKPAGLVVHPAPGHPDGTLVNALLARCNGFGGIGGKLRPGIVHRLDKDTSGLLVVAKTQKANDFLIEQFKKREVVRLYRVYVSGIVRQRKGRINVPIGRDRFNRKKFSPVSTKPREAVTNFKVFRVYGRCNITDLVCKLETGRTHQIRVHMSHIGHPVLGDRLYGFKITSIKDVTLRDMVKSMNMHALCAFYLSFIHPETGKRFSFRVDIPDIMKRIASYCRMLNGDVEFSEHFVK